MKKLYSLSILLYLMLTGQQVLAQQIGDLKGIHFQAVAIDDQGKEIIGMDINGKPVYNKTIGVRFTILKGASGPVLYQETHATLTDQHGLFSLVIGQGKLTSEMQYTTLMEVPWIDADQFLKVEIAIKNDGNYKLVSLQQFMAVPYSFYTDDIADNAITTAKILDETIQAEDIREGAVESSEILNGTVANEDIANGTIDLTAKVTNILPVANGGTGADSLTDGGMLVGGGITPVRALPAATNGQIPIGATGADPVMATLTSGAGIDITNEAGKITISSSVKGINTASLGQVSVGEIPAGENFVSSAIPMKGVVPGDFIVGSYSENLRGCVLTAYVFADDVIKVAIFNGNKTMKNLGTGELKVLHIK